MQDRVSLYPGRMKLAPVAGQENTYDMVRADSPTQEGTPLNKDSLLKDATAALFGLGADAAPDDVLALLKTLVDNAQISADGKAIAVYGSYKGTGTSGSNNPNSLTFDGKPLLVAILPNNTGGSMYGCGFLAVKDAPFLYTEMHSSNSYCTTSWTGNTLRWYNSGYPKYQFNMSGYTYYYVALLAAGE